MLHGIAMKLRFIGETPVVMRPVSLPNGMVVESPELAPGDMRNSCVKWLTLRAFRPWRDVGLAGWTPGTR
ncbi:hypothetical protein AQJ91_40920 [Streptomyces dysideae]|uniref:Uncharacterized protein n=1 Tax=Streptomyces dysideae TaxID=909626 RepID=A0A101URH8_9ACTN|nr:hypothetical protein AQJ91_40920 [Streptomyces dysideae]